MSFKSNPIALKQTSIGGFSLKDRSGYTGSDSLANNITRILSNIIGFITLIAGLAFIMYFMIGAINWITSAGDPTKTQKAQSTITNALIGLLITVIAYPVIQVISRLLGAPLSNPKELLDQLIF